MGVAKKRGNGAFAEVVPYTFTFLNHVNCEDRAIQGHFCGSARQQSNRSLDALGVSGMNAVQRSEEDKIPYSVKLEKTTNHALDQLFKPSSEPVAVEPVTLPEKIAACERKINSCKTEIDYLSEQLRPARLAQFGSRLGELRAEKSPEIRFAEETLRTKKADLAQLIESHRAFLADDRTKP